VTGRSGNYSGREGERISAHEVVSRYTSRIEALFAERGGDGAGLMQKAERFHYALSERDWDDLCWLNSEGRGVAEHDLERFSLVAERVLAAVEGAPRLNGHASSRAPNPSSARRAAPPRNESRRAPIRQESAHRSTRVRTRRRRTGLLPLAIGVVLIAGYYFQRERWASVWDSAQGIRERVESATSELWSLRRREAEPRRPQADADAGIGVSEPMPAASIPPSQLRTRKLAPQRARAAASAGAPAPDAKTKSKAARNTERPDDAAQPVPSVPDSPSSEVNAPPSPPDAHSPGQVRMTPEELKKF
jgi:hypothetical protein